MQQIEIFNALEYVDLGQGMTVRSTRTKDTKRRKTIAPVTENDRLTAQTIN